MIDDKVRNRGASAATLLRGVGRAALWAVLALLLIRGLADVLGSPAEQRAPASAGTPVDDAASDAFAVRFARAYLADPVPEQLEPLLADGARFAPGRAPTRGAAGVAQAEVARRHELGDGRAVLTVACELRDGRTLYLAVPVVRSGDGEVAALGAPWVVAAPEASELADPEEVGPLAGSEAGPISSLISDFLPAYLSAANPSELGYLLAPGARVTPLGGVLELRAVNDVLQLGSGEGRRRTVIAYARARDPVSGAAYSLAYRIEVLRSAERWYVASVQGALR